MHEIEKQQEVVESREAVLFIDLVLVTSQNDDQQKTSPEPQVKQQQLFGKMAKTVTFDAPNANVNVESGIAKCIFY